MKVIDPGHYYELANLDAPPGSCWALRFVKRVGDKYPGNEPPSYPGTTSQEVIRAVIDRIKYVDAQIDRTDLVSGYGHYTNSSVMYHLREALRWLEVRAAHERGDVAAQRAIEQMPVLLEDEPICEGCGHIMCNRDHGGAR